MDEPNKVCGRCGIEKPAVAFLMRAGHRRGTCRACINEREKARIKSSPERIAKYKATQSASQKKKWANDDFRARKRLEGDKWRANNPDKVAEIRRKTYAKNAEFYRVEAKEWRIANPEKVREQGRKKTEAMPDHYIRQVLRLSKEQCTPEIIAMKRAHIELIRLKAELNQALKQTINNQELHHVTAN